MRNWIKFLHYTFVKLSVNWGSFIIAINLNCMRFTTERHTQPKYGNIWAIPSICIDRNTWFSVHRGLFNEKQHVPIKFKNTESEFKILIFYASEHMLYIKLITMHSHREIPYFIDRCIDFCSMKNILVALAGCCYVWFLARLKTSGVQFKSHIKAIFESKWASPVLRSRCDCCRYFRPRWNESY